MEEKVLFLELVLTMECNANCEYCYQKNAPKVPAMSKEIIDKVCERIENDDYYTKFNITFFGGEPTLEKENILYLLDKLKDVEKDFRFSMPTNAKNVDDLVEIKRAINKNGWELDITLSNKDDVEIGELPQEILDESFYAFIFNGNNYNEITEEYIDYIREIGIRRAIMIKPDMYSDLSTIPPSEITRILELITGKGVLFSINLIDPDAIACIRDTQERVVVLGYGEYVMCTRVTMGCYSGTIGSVDETTFYEAVTNRNILATQISDTGLCLCKTNVSLKSAEYMGEIIDTTDGIYDGLIRAKD
jgi:uncharacterized protein